MAKKARLESVSDPSQTADADSGEEKARFEHYWEYAKLWRTWVVGIAVGAIFILLNKDMGGKFEDRASIAALFVTAAGLQVVLAWINKTSAYYGYRQSLSYDGRWLRFWVGVGDQYWIDFILDLASLGAVGWAVLKMIGSSLLASAALTSQTGP
jgi:hypothetical protein